MWDEWYNSGISLILGLLLLVLGTIPLLNQMGVIGFSLPAFLTGLIAKIFLYLAALGGVWLLFDAFYEDASDIMRWSSVLFGLVVLAAGVIPLLNQFGVIGFGLPFLNMTIYNVLFTLEGILLVIGSFSM